MQLHWSALTLASHLSLVFAIAFAFLNAIAVRRYWVTQSSLALFARLEGPIFAIAATLTVERLYYVGARLLVNSPLNLWRAHPAPEALSFAVAASVFWLAISIRSIGGAPGLQVRRALMLQSVFMVSLFTVTAWGLW